MLCFLDFKTFFFPILAETQPILGSLKDVEKRKLFSITSLEPPKSQQQSSCRRIILSILATSCSFILSADDKLHTARHICLHWRHPKSLERALEKTTLHRSSYTYRMLCGFSPSLLLNI